MTECHVTCTTCRTDTGGPKRWDWLCEACAEECADEHRKAGHNVELVVVRDESMLRRVVRESGRYLELIEEAH